MANCTKRRRLGSVVELPSGKHRARICVGYREDGRKRTMSKTFGTKREAEDWIVAKKVELGQRPDIGAGITLGRIWSAYEADKHVSPTTLRVYKWYVETVWLPALGDMDVTAIRPARVQSVLDTLTRENAKHGKTALSSVLSFAQQCGWIAENPLRGHTFTYPERDVADYDEDPFATIERDRDVWSVDTVIRCMGMIRGLPLEPAWLCCVGAGLRIEEALALRRMDVRRIPVGTREVAAERPDGTLEVVQEPIHFTQVAVHAARTGLEARKATKTEKGARIVSLVEAMGDRLWEIVEPMEDRKALICPVSAANQNKRWRGYFDAPSTSKHAPKKDGCNFRGRLYGLPYLPLSKMRNTHVTLMAEIGVSDSVNALMHGHTEMVERRHYLSPDTTSATLQASERLRLVV